MESTKAALESERKIQMLQMQAINALWKKVSALQPETGDSQGCSGLNMTKLSSGDNAEIVKELAQTCTVLQSQVTMGQGGLEVGFDETDGCRSNSCRIRCRIL